MTGIVRRFAAFIAVYWFLIQPIQAIGQELASLVADGIFVDPSGVITAEGNVVVFHNGTIVTAQSVTYSKDGDRLTIIGPITVTEADGSVLYADAATLDRKLQDGVLMSARLVLDQQLQLAAAEVARVGNRYTTLSRTVASSCEVCESNPTPLWDIRADRVIHDNLERQLHFENARIRVVGIPIFYLPRLRLPDPTLKRATGFLIPRFQTTSDLGTGIKVPYFIAAGDHADVTLTPYFSTSTSTLEYRYRHEIKNGEIDAIGAFSNDDIASGRSYLFAEAEYRLPRGFVAKGQIELVSDPGYLFLYDYSDKDRLTNEFSVTRVREKDLFRASITEFKTLRESEIPIRDTLPDRFVEISYSRDIQSLSFGGRTTARVDTAALNRPSSVDGDGRDVSRIGVGVDWRRSILVGPGFVATGELGARLDAYNVGQDSTFETNLTRFVPRAAAELRWPLARTTSDGGSEVLEPILRFDIADAGGDEVPLEDSRVVEFDEANLFSFSRYPGVDGVEDGTRTAIGLSWQRVDPDGWALDLAFGRVTSLDGSLGFADGSGLEGDQSEWLLAGRLAINDRLWIASRSLFDDSVDFTLSETRVDWQNDRARVGSSYIFAKPEPAEGRDTRLSELSFDGAVQLTDNWTASTDWRYDFTAGRATRVGLGLDYENECIRLDLSLSRRFATSTSVTPTTDFGFRVSLVGVGNGGSARDRRRVCRG